MLNIISEQSKELQMLSTNLTAAHECDEKGYLQHCADVLAKHSTSAQASFSGSGWDSCLASGWDYFPKDLMHMISQYVICPCPGVVQILSVYLGPGWIPPSDILSIDIYKYCIIIKNSCERFKPIGLDECDMMTITQYRRACPRACFSVCVNDWPKTCTSTSLLIQTFNRPFSLPPDSFSRLFSFRL